MTLTIAGWVLLASFFLPILAAGIAKAGRRDFDNAHPRDWEASLTGYRARAVAAMNNTYEALPFFAAAVIMAHLMKAPQGRLDTLAIVWFALRLIFLACYVGDRPSLRSLAWVAALAVTVWIFVLGA